MSYPECDRYECEECPRQNTCIERDGGDKRLQNIEDRLIELEEFADTMRRMLAAVVKAQEDVE